MNGKTYISVICPEKKGYMSKLLNLMKRLDKSATKSNIVKNAISMIVSHNSKYRSSKSVIKQELESVLNNIVFVHLFTSKDIDNEKRQELMKYKSKSYNNKIYINKSHNTVKFLKSSIDYMLKLDKKKME
jgi:hypothetical protein